MAPTFIHPTAIKVWRNLPPETVFPIMSFPILKRRKIGSVKREVKLGDQLLPNIEMIHSIQSISNIPAADPDPYPAVLRDTSDLSFG